MSNNKIYLNGATENHQGRKVNESELTEGELQNVVGGDYAQTMMVWFNLLGQMGFPVARPESGKWA